MGHITHLVDTPHILYVSITDHGPGYISQLPHLFLLALRQTFSLLLDLRRELLLVRFLVSTAGLSLSLDSVFACLLVLLGLILRPRGRYSHGYRKKDMSADVSITSMTRN